MKTTQKKAIDAYRALMAIQARKELTTIQTSRKLFDLKKELKPTFDFQCEREREIVKKLGFEINPETGVIGPAGDDTTPEQYEQLRKEFDALADLEIDIKTEKISVPSDEELHVSMDEIEALDGFVSFE